ncbi:MAG TPA: adenosylmethionine--8-amino-7-oxononanoate transaminase [Acidimicrobiales bacterium]|nr:adenosylmethionine--8-amino-7-oxononanoate transaminase [Acidimicrobiales bacterium]
MPQERREQAIHVEMTGESPTSRYDALLEKNRRHLWNPFTQMRGFLESSPPVITRGEGVRLFDSEGRGYFDGNSSLWVNIHGHGRPELNEALVAQAGRVAHSTLLGMSNEPAIELSERLAAIAPGALSKVFFSDSGAAAVEIGLKIAFAYWRRVGRPEKRRFVAFENGYHGDTVGAMSVGGIDVFQAEFAPLLFDVERVGFPASYRLDTTPEEAGKQSIRALEALFDRLGGEVACIVIEPLIQGAGGMVTMPSGFLTEVVRLAHAHEVLVLADEVATGFGRTGAMFACDTEGVAPDLMTVGKGLTGGYLPVAATLATDEIYAAFLGEYAELKALFHGHSFTGNQLGCAVALASLDLFERDDLLATSRASAEQLATGMKAIADMAHVGDVRQCGLMIGIELVSDRESHEPFDWRERMGFQVCERARELGMLTRPLSDVVVFMPPLSSTPKELREMVGILEHSIVDVTDR